MLHRRNFLPLGRLASSSSSVCAPRLPPLPLLLLLDRERFVSGCGCCTAALEEDDSATDEFINQLKDEVLLQSLLHKRMLDQEKRVFQLEHRNGKKMLVVFASR